jgi:hypothetical protein
MAVVVSSLELEQYFTFTVEEALTPFSPVLEKSRPGLALVGTDYEFQMKWDS